MLTSFNITTLIFLHGSRYNTYHFGWFTIQIPTIVNFREGRGPYAQSQKAVLETAENYLHVIKHGETKELPLLTLILTKIETKVAASI